MQTTSQSSLKPGSLKIVAPLGGILVPLDQVPDPVFAQKMVGDGISLDPISDELLAPVAGTVTQLHNAHHALTITTGWAAAEGLRRPLHSSAQRPAGRALVAQRIEHLTTDQEVAGSNPAERTEKVQVRGVVPHQAAPSSCPMQPRIQPRLL